MNNGTLNSLLKDYERKRNLANTNFEKQKLEFYNLHPELAEIKHKLGELALDISKAVLKGDIELEKSLKDEYNELNQKKDHLLNSIEVPKRSFSTFI